MKKFFAVAMTAAFVLPSAAVSAAAQGETITVEGLFYIDRNGDNAFTAGENVRAGGPGVQIRVQGTNELVGTFPTGPDGRYRAVLPKGPKYVTSSLEKDYSSTRLGHDASESRTDADYPLRGYFLNGVTFVDTNGDGVKQAEEKTHGGKVKVTGQVHSGAQFSGEAQAGPDGAYQLDLPFGALTLTAPDLTKDGLALAKPRTASDVDWVSGTTALVGADNREVRADVRYVEARADIALSASVVPAKDSYVLGEQVDVKLTLANKGNVPVVPSVVMAEFVAKLVSHSDNIKLINGRDDEFETVAKILPGEQADVVLKVELNDLTFDKVQPIVRFNFGNLQDVDRKNNVLLPPIAVKVVEKGTTAPTTSTSPSQSAVPTTTAPAVAKAGNGSGLASTGASVFGPLALGAVLLAVGASAFFVARRRRS
ncbi:hypothetical protein [Lentzea albida]|uniref:Gram-positive cocci surface proteins LPxTG domain-containing protein n=1 Tax=Lentzea albida TaxID=65499 RepID=A0A1H9NGR3_9PSEU|nr:hypothetical protein [Lentzea albida]SER34583.1 hypothetical protein SAMN04488000_108116 [Lentzea albida]